LLRLPQALSCVHLSGSIFLTSMACTRVTLPVLVLVNAVLSSDASAFLAQSEDRYITNEDVERTLLSELSDGMSMKLRGIKDELRPMFAALPKTEEGRLEPSVVRYALHRYFVQTHGWYMMGLDPKGGSWDAQAPSRIMKDRAPAYIQSLFEKRFHGHGLGLHELAVFAAVLSDLVHKEASGEVHKVFTHMRLDTVDAVSAQWSEAAVKAYMMQFFAGAELNITGMEHLNFVEEKLVEIYPDWPGTNMWVQDMRLSQDLLLQASTRNPFVPHHDSFEGSVAFVQELWHHFGSFQDLECKALKGRLLEMEHQGTGRVLLSQFYAGGVKGDWALSESVDYLRNLGVLDESNPKRPSVVISNYLTSQTNCLSASGFYSVCCSDECEGLLQQLERGLGAPSAAPQRITELVSAMQSDTVEAPRNLSTALLSRLDEIAQLHAGRVPLHGRLFAQWMHHTYPRECPYPHVSGTTTPLSPDAWMAHHGIDNVEASLEEMQNHHARLEQELALGEEVSLPWTQVEELVSGQSGSGATAAWLSRLLRCTMALAALASLALPLWRAAKAAVPGEPEKFLV